MTFEDMTPAVHAVATGSILGAVLGWLPPIASVLALIWYSIEIYESKTFQRAITNWRSRKIVKLKARIVELELEAATPPASPSPPANQ